MRKALTKRWGEWLRLKSGFSVRSALSPPGCWLSLTESRALLGNPPLQLQPPPAGSSTCSLLFKERQGVGSCPCYLNALHYPVIVPLSSFSQIHNLTLFLPGPLLVQPKTWNSTILALGTYPRETKARMFSRRHVQECLQYILHTLVIAKTTTHKQNKTSTKKQTTSQLWYIYPT